MTILNFIDERLDLMLAHPQSWGGAEAFELQVLLLLELRQVVRADVEVSTQSSLRLLLDEYSAFLRPLFPELGPRPLSSELDDPSAIATPLGQFRESLAHEPSIARVLPPPPPAPTDLGLDVLVGVEGEEAVMPRKAAA